MKKGEKEGGGAGLEVSSRRKEGTAVFMASKGQKKEGEKQKEKASFLEKFFFWGRATRRKGGDLAVANASWKGKKKQLRRKKKRGRSQKG